MHGSGDIAGECGNSGREPVAHRAIVHRERSTLRRLLIGEEILGRLIRWEPLTGMSRQRDEINRLLEDYFDESAEERAPAEMARILLIDVVDRKDDVLVQAEISGIDKENLHIEALQDAVMICVDMRQEHEEKEQNFIRRERRLGTFQRIIPMPSGVKPGDV